MGLGLDAQSLVLAMCVGGALGKERKAGLGTELQPSLDVDGL